MDKQLLIMFLFFILNVLNFVYTTGTSSNSQTTSPVATSSKPYPYDAVILEDTTELKAKFAKGVDQINNVFLQSKLSLHHA